MKTNKRLIATTLMTAALTLGTATAMADHGGGWFGGHGEGKSEMCDGKGKRGGHHKGMQTDLKLNADQVKTLAQARLIKKGKTDQVIGTVTPAANNTFDVQILNADNTLLETQNISSATGRPTDGKGWGKRGHHGKWGKSGRDLQLNADQVRTLMSAKLIYRNNPRLQLGNIQADANGNFNVDIMTVDNSLVETITISAANGRRTQAAQTAAQPAPAAPAVQTAPATQAVTAPATPSPVPTQGTAQ